jgi:uncharacterized membrane protein
VKEWLKFIIENTITIIVAMALVIIVIGTIEAFFLGLWAMLSRSATKRRMRDIWIRYSHWLVAGLTFQLATDIIETSIAPNWDDIGRLAAIAVIRTFINFFLERDLVEGEQREEPAMRT